MFRFLKVCVTLLLLSATLSFAAPLATTTQLSLSSSSVSDGTAVTLTAKVTNPSAVTKGTVLFCNASAAHCEDIAVLGSAQITSSGTASIKVILGVGTHSIKAAYLGTTSNAASISSAQTLTVTGNSSEITTTSLSEGGTVGNYTLSGSVAHFGVSSPTGQVALLDQTAGNLQIGEATLGPPTTTFASIGYNNTDSTPQSIAVGDFNDDGMPDMVTANSGSNTVSVLLGKGDGTFQAEVSYATGSEPYGVAVGDVNGDGIPDLVTANYGDGTVSVLLGNGDGTFQTEISYGAGYQPQSIVVGDFNGDGNLDLAVASLGYNTVSVLLGNGDGTFQAPVTYSTGVACCIAVGDFNGDGILDLVTANSANNTISVFIGKGDGTFQPQVTYPTGSYPRGIAVGDLNGDGVPDLVTANYQDNTVSVLLGKGDGTFQPQVTYPTGGMPWGIAVGDLNGDGTPDVVVADNSGNEVAVLYGNGDGTLQAQATYWVSNAMAIAVGGFNSDDSVGFAVLEYNTSGVSVYQRSQLSSFSVSGINITGGTSYFHNIIGTFLGDSVYAASSSGSVPLRVTPTVTTTQLSLSSNTVTFGTAVILTATVTNPSPLTQGSVRFCDASAPHCENSAILGSADLTSSGTASINLRLGVGTHNINAVFAGTAVNGSSVSSTQVLTVNANGSLVPTGTSLAESGSVGNYTLSGSVTTVGNGPLSGFVNFVDQTAGNAQIAQVSLGAPSLGMTGPTPYNVGTSPWAAATGDFNGDGIPDLAVVNYASNSVSVLLGNGGGTYAPEVSYATGNNPEAVAIGDFNGDGIPDLVVGNYNGGTVSVLLGNGNGTFSPQVAYNCGSNPKSVAIGDFNGDGIPDLAVTNFVNQNVTILLGNGDGTFTMKGSFATGGGAWQVAVGDFNGDGIADLAVVNLSGNTVAILTGKGDGTFNFRVTYPTGSTPQGVAVGDFNGDGFEDLAVANDSSNTVSILLGNGNGTFKPQVTYATGTTPNAIVVGDFNGDGNSDIVVSNQNSNTLSLLLGNGDGTFKAQSQFPTVASPVYFSVGDFNNDGVLDFAVVDEDNNAIDLQLGSESTGFSVSGVTVIGGASTHNIVGAYTGDAVHSASTSPSVALTSQQVPTITWATPTPISYGNALSSTQLDATASVPGTFSFSPAAGAILGPGAHTLTATFTPTDTVTYTSTTASVQLVVEKITTTTELSLSSSTVPQGSVVTLTASVTNPSPITAGTVFFCNASAAHCEDSALLGSAQLTSVGSAAIHLRMGVGVHNINAIFVGTIADAMSTSTTQTLNVTGNSGELTSTSLSETGSAGNYTLSGSVKSTGNAPFAGAVKFLDTSVGNSEVGDAVLATPTMEFSSPSIYEEGSEPYKVAVSDFNSDGIPDIAVSDIVDKSLSVFLGNGDGTFQAPLKTSIGFGAISIAVGDFNGDGLPDIAALNEGSTSVSVLLGKGDGTFQSPVSYATGGYEYDPFSLAVADSNGDGIADLIMSNNNGNSVSVLLGKGDGTFQSPHTSPAGSWPTIFVVADFNGDDIPDLALLHSGSNSVSILLGNGDGTFQAPVNVATSFSPQGIAVGDFNGDGKADLVLLNYSGNSVSVLLGNGDGTFLSPVSYATGSTPEGVKIADFNGDGKADLVLLSFSGNSVSVLLGNGDGTFLSPVSYATGSNQNAIAIGDFNGDGAADLVVTLNSSTSNLLVLMNSEVANFTASGIAVSGGSSSSHNVVATFAGDSVHSSSTSAPVALEVAQQTPTITWATPVAISYGTPLSGSQLDASASVPGTFSFSPAIGTVLSTGTQTLTATFTPADTIDYTTATAQVSLVVNKAVPSISAWPSASAITYGQTLASSTLTGGTPSVGGSFGWTTASTSPNAGIQTESVTFTPTDTADYTSAAGSVSITVNQATATVNLGNLTQTYTGSPLEVTATTSPAGLLVNLTYNGSSSAPTTAGSYAVVATINDTNYQGTASGTLVIGKATPSVSVWPTASAITYGQTIASSTLAGGTSSVGGSFAWTTQSATPNAGFQTESVTFTPIDSVDYSIVTGSASVTVNKAAPTIEWQVPSPITYGTALSAAQLDATSVPGSFSYSPALGSVLPVGTQTLTVTFTPTDTADYTTATAQVNLSVTRAPATINVQSSEDPSVYGKSITYTFTFTGVAGMAIPTGQATITSDSANIGTVTLDATGKATFSLSTLSAGTHTIRAVYSGDPNYF